MQSIQSIIVAILLLVVVGTSNTGAVRLQETPETLASQVVGGGPCGPMAGTATVCCDHPQAHSNVCGTWMQNNFRYAAWFICNPNEPYCMYLGAYGCGTDPM